MGHLFAHKAQIDGRFYLAQRMLGAHPLLRINRVVKELRLAVVEPSGTVMFQVERFDSDGRVVKVNSKETVVWLMISVLGLSVDF